jgi:hypothetical protein
MEIFKAPNILILTLQRFKSGHKNSDLIDFPIEGLDLKPYVKMHDSEMLYDLYAVVNHSGSLSFGHYTAKCLNETTQRWHNYNDSMVSDIDSNSIVNNSAYVLFYKRRGFTLTTAEDFEKIRCQPSGHMEHLLQKTKLPTKQEPKELKMTSSEKEENHLNSA